LALSYDRAGHPQTLTVSANGTLSRARNVPAALLNGVRGNAGAVQVSAALDLSDAEDRGRVQALLHALAPAHVLDLPGAVAALAGAIADHGAIDIAAYHDSKAGLGVDVGVGLGAQAGVSAELSRTNRKLVGAWSRPPGGAWERRLDCLA
jgi:hypothetical protein